MVAAIVLFDALRALPAQELGGIQKKAPLGLACFGAVLLCASTVRTALAVHEAMPELKAKYDYMLAHPPDQAKLQDYLTKLQNGETTASLMDMYQAVQASTATVTTTTPLPAPAPEPVQ
jgi:hypothetical protein